MDIGKRIRDRRIELNLSVDELAIRLNKNRTTVYRYEKGDIENLPLDTLKPLAEILETTPAYLMGWTDENSLPVKDSSEHNKRLSLYMTFDRETFSDEEYKYIEDYIKFLIYRRTIK